MSSSSSLSVMGNWARAAAPHGGMVFVQVVFVSYLSLSKVIFVQGTSTTVFILYQLIVSTLLLGLLAFIFERKRIPPLTKGILWGTFLAAFVGLTFGQLMLATALYFISSTIEASVLNLVPAITFILCVITRQETLRIYTMWGNGKLFGTLISVSGGLTLILWHQNAVSFTTKDASDWAIGLAMLISGVIATSMWIIMLGTLTRSFPAELSMTAIMLFFATMQTLVVALIVNREASQWKLKSGLELLNVAVGGALTTGLNTFIAAWCAGLKGPVFVSSFNPLATLFAAIVDVLFLGYGLNAGSVVGSILIVLGFYMYLWSKHNEDVLESKSRDTVNPNSEINTSLLVHNRPSDHLPTTNNV